MATVTELKSVVKDTLEKRGVLGQIKARIRTEVFNALDDRSAPRPPLSHENLLINELIREYLEFNKYRYTASVLSAESGQPDLPLDRQFMVDELNIVEDTNGRAIPLLYGILATFLQSKKEDYVHPTISRISPRLPRRNVHEDNDRREIGDRPEPVRLPGASNGGTFTLKGKQ